MTEAGRGALGGFWVPLPEGWVSIDVDPSTSILSTRKLVEAAAADDEADLGGSDGRVVDLVELDSGPAVRRRGRRSRLFPGAEEPVEFVSHQYFVRVPSTADRVALLSFATPTLAVEDDLGDLFESMARSFMFTWSGGAG